MKYAITWIISGITDDLIEAPIEAGSVKEVLARLAEGLPDQLSPGLTLAGVRVEEVHG